MFCGLYAADGEHIFRKETILHPVVQFPKQLGGFAAPGQGQVFQGFILGGCFSRQWARGQLSLKPARVSPEKSEMTSKSSSQ